MAELTQLELYREAEWRMCRKDVRYFLEHYWNVQTIGVGYGTFKLRDYQVEDLDALERAIHGKDKARQIRLKARQIGWTTLATGVAFWDAFFHHDHPWLIASQGQDEAADTLSTKIKIPYSQLPKWMRERGPQVTTETQEVLNFDNNSRIIAIPSTSSSGRSKAVFGVLMDEAAFMENADELFAALDPLCYGPLFVFSTANGMGNFFHETWQESQLADSEWRGEFRPWNVHPDRDEEWYQRTKRKYRTRPYLFYQEYPSSPEEAFARSGNTALPMDLVRALPYRDPEFRLDLALLDTENMDFDAEVEKMMIPRDEERDLELHVWQRPYQLEDEDGRLLQEPNFVVGVDVSEGLEDGDYSAISVIDVNEMEVVATLKAHVPVEDLGDVVAWIGYWYYIALIGVERNNMGLVPLTRLSYINYPRLYRMDTIAQQKRGDRSRRYGWHTNKASKPKMVVDFQKELRAESVLLYDARFLHEAGTFLADGKGGFGASRGNHDDLIMSVLIAIQLMLDVGQYPILWRPETPGPLTFGDFIRLSLEIEEEQEHALAKAIGQTEQDKGFRRSFEVIR